ncbi:MAG: Iron transporter substrate-binding protein [Thermoleophilia bacterium]|nr:Iron transporter substrate-binding protein [Thermoleophilia bacterium]
MSPLPSVGRRALAVAATLVFAATVAAGCGNDDSDSKSGSKADSGTKLVIYSGREKKLVDPLYKEFERSSGIDLEVRYAESPAMAAQLLEEGDKSPADVFYSQDAGAIGAVEELLAPLPDGIADEVDAQYRDNKGRWTGVTGRIRTLVYNTDELKEGDLPDSVLGVTDPKWKGKIGVAPTNASFIAFVSALRLDKGDDAAKDFLEGLVANEPKIYEKNGPIVDAVSKGEVQIGLVNHYYLYERLAEDPDAPVANHFFEAGDVGNLVNVSAMGILKTSEHKEAARKLIDFMLHDGQRFIVEEAPEREYPLVVTEEIESNERYTELPPLDQNEGPDVELSDLGAELETTVGFIRDSGLTS